MLEKKVMLNAKSLLLRIFGGLLAFAIVLPLSASFAATGSYPSKQVQLIIPFVPGGSSDIVGRVVATMLSKQLGMQVIAFNRGGAGGTIAMKELINSKPDGYTLLFTASGIAYAPWLYNLPYDPVKAFAPIGMIGNGPILLNIYPGVPANSVKELIALAKKQPGKLINASSGIGSSTHLMSSLFFKMSGITPQDVMTVQFKGAGPAITDVMGGHSHICFTSLLSTLPQIKSGQLKPLGIGGSTRSDLLPDVPTISEAGVPGYQATAWWGIFAPAGTPMAIVDRLYKEIQLIMKSEDMKETFAKMGSEIELMGPAEFGKFFEVELVKWGKVIKSLSIKGEDVK